MPAAMARGRCRTAADRCGPLPDRCGHPGVASAFSRQRGRLTAWSGRHAISMTRSARGRKARLPAQGGRGGPRRGALPPRRRSVRHIVDAGKSIRASRRGGTLPAGSRALGIVPGSKLIHLGIALTPRSPGALAEYAAEVSTPGAPGFGARLTPAEFRERFGPTPSSVRAVEQSMRADGFELGELSANGLLLHVSAPVDAVEGSAAPEVAHLCAQLGRARLGGFCRPDAASGDLPRGRPPCWAEPARLGQAAPRPSHPARRRHLRRGQVPPRCPGRDPPLGHVSHRLHRGPARRPPPAHGPTAVGPTTRSRRPTD